MQICGLNKTTLLDYPGHVAATIFLGGCNFRCPYCHNRDLVLNPGSTPSILPEELDAFLSKRKNILSGICITGGEPTLHNDLPKFIKKIKVSGYHVKLDTNGTNPEMLEKLLHENLLDYVAMDIKSDLTHYADTCGLNHDFTLKEAFPDSIKASVEILKHCGIDYEFRTTIVKELHTEEILTNMACWLGGCNAYFLQNYEENENVLSPGFHSYTREELEQFALIFKPHCKHVGIRGV